MNLVSVCNSTDKKVIWKFLKEYDESLNAQSSKLLDILIEYAINYYIDFILPSKKYLKINDENKTDEKTRGRLLENYHRI